MSGVHTSIRFRSGVKQKRCAAKEHEGDRWVPFDEYLNDRSQPLGKKSQCRDCYLTAQQVKRNTSPAYTEQAREYVRGRTAKRDEADERKVAAAEAEGRRIAADRERRLKDDHEPLKVDDFTDDDVGVANDPGSRKASAAAGREKRQEYNRAMGRQANAVRAAVVAETNLTGNLIDSMPAESGAYVGALAEQERRFGNRRLARSISLFAAGEEQARRLWMMACRQYLTDRVQPTGYAARPRPDKPAPRTVCVLLSDLHIGAELGQSDNPMPFRAVEEARRLEYVMRQVIDYKPQYRKDTRLKILINGDVIEGLLMHDFRDGAPLTEQKVAYHTYMERFIGECARAYPGVDVHIQGGNHGRNLVRHPGRATSSKWDSHEVTMAYGLSRACQALKNVKFDIRFRAVSAIDLYGQWLLMTHGDTEVKLGDPDTKARDNRAAIDKINATRLYGVEFAAAAFGHFHKPRYLPGQPRMIFNGALVPPNGHARGAGYIGEACGQWLWEATAGYPIGDVRFIEVGQSQDRDEKLGKIIVPFRFDLDSDVFPT